MVDGQSDVPVPLLQEAECSPGTIWMGAKNLDPTGIRNPEGPAPSYSLNRLGYPGPRR